MQKGDRIFFYHTGDEKAVVGIVKAAGAMPTPDPADKTGKLYAVEVAPVKQAEAAGDARGDQGGQGVRRLRPRARCRGCR